MTSGRSLSVAVAGVTGRVVEVHADIGEGLPSVSASTEGIGPQTRDRIRAAITNSGEQWPDGRVLLAASASVPLPGTAHDLALAVAVLTASGAVPAHHGKNVVFLGELALDGRLRRCRGLLPAVLTARANNHRAVVVSEQALTELAAVDGIDIFAATDLRAVLGWLRRGRPLTTPEPVVSECPLPATDIGDVTGLSHAKRVLEIAAAGGHHLGLLGGVGSGKTLLAQCLPGILPPLTDAQALEVATIASAAGTDPNQVMSRMPPYVAPHHSTSVTAMIGGGSPTARPDAVSRAHHGVLFLDDVTELGTRVREALLAPLAEGEVRIARRDGITRYPARFQLVAASCVCPCGAATETGCGCSPVTRRRYLHRLTGAWSDHIDIWVHLSPTTPRRTDPAPETSDTVRARVTAARAVAARRWREHGYTSNAEVPGTVLRHGFRYSRATTAPIESALHTGRLSTRAADSVLRLAWTLCDLRAADQPSKHDVTDASILRQRTQPPLT